MALTVLRYLVALIVIVGILRLPPRRKRAGIVAGLFLLVLPYLDLDSVDAWLSAPPSPELQLCIAVTILVRFFMLRRELRVGS
jgi:hypothetical protein